MRAPSPVETEKQTVPDGLVLGAAARAGDAGDADADVGAQRRARAVGQRLGDLDRHRADARRSAPASTPASAVFASLE